MKLAAASHRNELGISSLLSKNPPNKMDVRKHKLATALASATRRLHTPIAMQRHVATIFVKMSTTTKASKFNSPPSFKPIIPYVIKPNKNGGTTRIGKMSNKTVETKYAFVPYTRFARSRIKRRRSSFHTGSEESDMSVRKMRMKNNAPILF